jgi:hypothetical protein
VDAHRFLTEPAQELAPVRDLAAYLDQGLAHLQGHQQGRVLLALLHQFERPPQDLPAYPRSRRRPRLPRRDRGVQRPRGVLHVGVRDPRDHLARGGVAHLERRAADRVHPLPADEQLSRSPRQQGRLCGIRHTRR